MHPLTVYEIAVRDHAQATERRALARLHDSRRAERPASAPVRRSVRIRTTTSRTEKRTNR